MPRWPAKSSDARKTNAWENKSRKAKAATMDALKDLYTATPLGDAVASGVAVPEKPAKAKYKPKAKRKARERKEGEPPLERDEQAIVVVHCDRLGIPFFAIPNASRRTFWEAMQAKKQGMKAGVLDLCFPVPMQGKGGLWIEMKKQSGGVISPVQHYWIALLRENNFRVEVAEGAEKAIAIITDYFKGWTGVSHETNKLLQDVLDAKRKRE
jgi:hypothetical protein